MGGDGGGGVGSGPGISVGAALALRDYQNFATADGWIVVACPKEKFWRRLCEAIGRPELAADARFADFGSRDQHRDELLAELDAAFATRPTDAWLAELGAAGVPSAPVNDVAAALADPQAVARGAVVEAEHERFGTVRTLASPLRVGPERRVPERAPRRGEHTEQVLAELCGYTSANISRHLALLTQRGLVARESHAGRARKHEVAGLDRHARERDRAVQVERLEPMLAAHRRDSA